MFTLPVQLPGLWSAWCEKPCHLLQSCLNVISQTWWGHHLDGPIRESHGGEDEVPVILLKYLRTVTTEKNIYLDHRNQQVVIFSNKNNCGLSKNISRYKFIKKY